MRVSIYSVPSAAAVLNFFIFNGPKRISTPHFTQIILGFQSRKHLSNLLVMYLVITPEGHSRRKLKAMTAESMAKLLGAALRHSLGCLDRTLALGVSKNAVVTTGSNWLD